MKIMDIQGTELFYTLQKKKRIDDVDHVRILTEAFVNVPVQVLAVLYMSLYNTMIICRVPQKSVNLKHSIILTEMFRFKPTINL
jgi:hypothetical protein